MLRTYRLAVAATGEYTQFHGGVVEAQAAIVTTMARVNQIFERDLSIHMTLVGNNQLLVYDNPATDPYSNSNAGAMISQNQETLDDVIGSANYDIGHVFSTYGGGLAYVGAGCVTGFKAGGVTGRSSPVGEAFDVDFVAHEMGHQWGAEHTFNSELGSCSGNSRSANNAFEPGSGSTILAYAGICANDNLQLNSDAYFHARSLDQMLDYTDGVAPFCGAFAAVNANPPQVDAGGDHVIPAGTPFELTAVALSGEESGESFTYTWEQWDLGGPSALSEGDTGQGPLIRSLPPVTEAVRSIPSLDELQANRLLPGIALPQTARELNFRVTIRDNHPAGGRIGEDFMTVTSIDTGGPFALTFPNGGGILEGGQTITWDVAGTTGNGINTAQVDILLSADDGLTWPYTLASATPNDGSEPVSLPQIVTTRARIRVQPVNNIFFDLSDEAFSIGLAEQCTSPDLPITLGTAQSSLVFADDRSIRDAQVYVLAEHTWVGDVSLSLEHVDTGTTVTLLDRPGVPASTWGCSDNDVDVLFSDAAATPAEDDCNASPPAIAGTRLPAEPLSAFAGETLQGQWRLTVADAAAVDDGTLLQWCLTVQGVTEPEIDVQPPLLDFGNIPTDEGPSEPLLVQVENTGLAALEISEITIAGSHAGLFEITSDSGEASLDPGQARLLEIRFDPDSTGAKAAVLRISSDDADEAVTDIILQGNGSAAASVIFSNSFEQD
jgi:subtilisin-like proprotein convertase family protein